MAFKSVPGDLAAATGSVETIQIVPAVAGTMLTIVSVLYGTNANGPISVPVNPDKISFDLTVLTGSNLLQVSLFSVGKRDGSAKAQQTIGGTTAVLEDDIEFVGGVAIWAPEILGTP